MHREGNLLEEGSGRPASGIPQRRASRNNPVAWQVPGGIDACLTNRDCEEAPPKIGLRADPLRSCDAGRDPRDLERSRKICAGPHENEARAKERFPCSIWASSASHTEMRFNSGLDRSDQLSCSGIALRGMADWKTLVRSTGRGDCSISSYSRNWLSKEDSWSWLYGGSIAAIHVCQNWRLVSVPDLPSQDCRIKVQSSGDAGESLFHDLLRLI